MKITQFIFYFVFAAPLCGVGCSSSKPIPEPLAGWHTASKNPDQLIVNDYQNYIHTLSTEEQKFAGTILVFEDGTGQYAVRIEIGLSGTWWQHVLIYDKDDKRIKVIKYADGHYAS